MNTFIFYVDAQLNKMGVWGLVHAKSAKHAKEKATRRYPGKSIYVTYSGVRDPFWPKV